MNLTLIRVINQSWLTMAVYRLDSMACLCTELIICFLFVFFVMGMGRKSNHATLCNYLSLIRNSSFASIFRIQNSIFFIRGLFAVNNYLGCRFRFLVRGKKRKLVLGSGSTFILLGFDGEIYNCVEEFNFNFFT